MEEQMAQKSSELEQYLQRVKELEDMYHQLEEALEDERQAKLDEEAMRKLQARCTSWLVSVCGSHIWFHLAANVCVLSQRMVCVCVLWWTGELCRVYSYSCLSQGDLLDIKLKSNLISNELITWTHLLFTWFKFVFFLHPRLLHEEAGKRAELEQLHHHQQQALSQTEAEKQELVAEHLAKERQLKAAMLQLDKLERERQGALEKYEVRTHYVKALIKTLFAFYYSIIWVHCLQHALATFEIKILNHHLQHLPLLAM